MTETTERTVAQIPSLRDPAGIKITDEIRAQFPAVFSEVPASHMSDKYQFYPTVRLIEDMDRLGMKLVQLGQQQSRAIRAPTGRDPNTQMHIVRFQPQRADGLGDLKVDGLIPEIAILNSHNGRNRFQAYAGVFRLVCLNGMVVSDRDLGRIRTRHFGATNGFDTIKELVHGMADRVSMLGDKLATWDGEMLPEALQAELAQRMLQVRQFPAWLEPWQLIEARREEDAVDANGNRSLWTTFNVIQENVMKGDIDRQGEGRGGATKAITGAHSDIMLNQALWGVLDTFYYDRINPDARPKDEPEVVKAKATRPKAAPKPAPAPKAKKPGRKKAAPTAEVESGATEGAEAAEVAPTAPETVEG